MLTIPIISHIFQFVVPTVEETIVVTVSTNTNRRNLNFEHFSKHAHYVSPCVFYVMYFIASHSFVFYRIISNILLLRTIFNHCLLIPLSSRRLHPRSVDPHMTEYQADPCRGRHYRILEQLTSKTCVVKWMLKRRML